jgi:hypothetical protein
MSLGFRNSGTTLRWTPIGMNFLVMMLRRYQTPSTFRASSTALPMSSTLHDWAARSCLALAIFQHGADGIGLQLGNRLVPRLQNPDH